MANKGLILYSSLTGNTEKVAMRFKKVFTDQGWECDAFKIDRNTDYKDPPFDLEKYDFLCVGSYVILELPAEELVNMMCKHPLSGHCGQPTREEVARQRLLRDKPNYYPPPERPKNPVPMRNIAELIRSGKQKGIVFATYGGAHLGPKEAAPCLSLLESEMEHLGFACVGKFACPGSMSGHGHGDESDKDSPPPEMKGEPPPSYHKDMRNRPNERDLLKAEFFLEDKLEELGY